MPTTSTIGEVRPEHDRATGSDLVLLHYVRGFAMPVVDLWSRITETFYLKQWFGEVVGEPLDGDIDIDLGSALGWVHVHVEHCTSPHRLDLRVDQAILEVRLHQVGVVTTLELVRRHLHPDQVATTGPIWQLYLDRLEASIALSALPEFDENGYAQLAGEYRCPG